MAKEIRFRTRLSPFKKGEKVCYMAVPVSNGVTIVEQEEDRLGQRIIAHLSDATAPGQYRLRLNTHGYGTPTADLYTFMKSVTVE